MYTQPKISDNRKPGQRAYVITMIDGHRFRFYNGKRLPGAPHINPNKAATSKERGRLLQELQFQVIKALKAGWLPASKSLQGAMTSAIECTITFNGKQFTGILSEVRSTGMNIPKESLES